jgi:non-ribosomal peptide synthetase component F
VLWETLRASALDMPGLVACAEAGRNVTYGALAAVAEATAREIAVVPGSPVGVAVVPGCDHIATAWAIWASQSVYVPLSPTDPPARTARRISELALETVLADEHDLATVAGACEIAGLPYRVDRSRRGPISHVRISAPPATPLPASCAAIYPTSGSTGQPKNVAIDGSALLNVARWSRRTTGIRPASRVAQCYPPTFDAFLLVALEAALSQACLVFPPHGWTFTPGRMARWLRDSAITHLDMTPSTLRLLTRAPGGGRLTSGEPPLPVLQALVLGGEMLPWSLAGDARSLSPQVEIFNMYGLTESTVTAVAYRVPARPPPGALSVPIGKAVPGITAELDCRPDGIHELVLSGSGVSPGYLSRGGRELCPFPSAYRTGDLVAPDGAGDLVFIGRADRQLSLRGHRVEAAEIEEEARALPSVTEAAAFIYREAGIDRLALAYKPAPASPPREPELRETLRRILPPEWQPRYLLRCREIPLTNSGKRDEVRLTEWLTAQLSAAGAARH